MRDLFNVIFSDMRYGGFGGFIIGLLMLIGMGILVIVIGVGIFWAVDSINTPEVKGTGTIVDWRFEPEHTVYNHVHAGKVNTTVPRKVADAWYVTVEMDGETDEVEVSHDYYNKAHFKTNEVDIMYSKGRISDDLYVTEILN